MALTVKRMARLANKPGRYRDGEVKGLYYEVKSPTNRNWVLRFQLRGPEHMKGLGSVETFPLPQQARQRALDARRLLADGINPILASRTERAEQAKLDARNKTFSAVVGEYYDAQSDGWSAKHRANFLGSLKNHVYPTLGQLPIGMIDERLVLDVLQPIWKTKTTTATRLQRSLAAIFDFAISQKLRDDNPAKWKGNLKHQLAAPNRLARVEHRATLHYNELTDFMRELRGLPGIPARALEFLILTSARSGDVIGARWQEIDLEQRQWVVPAENERQSRTPRTAIGSSRDIAAGVAKRSKQRFSFHQQP